MSERCTYRVIWSVEDQEYVGLCAAFPSLSWLAATPEAALAGIRALMVEVMRDLAVEEREAASSESRTSATPDV